MLSGDAARCVQVDACTTLDEQCWSGGDAGRRV